MAELHLVVDGRRYEGWKSVRVTRSMESVAGSFSLDVSDRWARQETPWPIREEDACRIEIAGQVVIDGYVDVQSIAVSATSRSLSYQGRDRTAALVDCSADLAKWTFRQATVLDIAAAVAAPHGVSVSLQPGLALPRPLPKLVVSPGSTAFSVIEQAAAAAGVMVMSDGQGGLVFARSGTARAAPLVYGRNLLDVAVDYAAADRFSSYLVLAQVGGTDAAAGGATRIRGAALDAGVRRTSRLHIIRPETGATAEYAQRRADWEARRRAARAETVTASVLGWTQPDGALWPINALASVDAAPVGVRGDLLISEVDFTKDARGEVTRLRLVRPDAYLPEPQAVVARGGGVRRNIHQTEAELAAVQAARAALLGGG